MYPQDPTPPATPNPFLNLDPNLTPPDQTGSAPAPTPYPTTTKHENPNPLSVMEPGEQVICEIKRHPIGIIGIYVISGALLLAIAILSFVVAPAVITSTSRSQIDTAGALIFVIVATVSFLFTFVANKVYWGNSWVVTSDSITQITQTSLFNKQSSQLSLGNLEDVTAEQDGILPHMFNYGRLRVETAGERSKFLFAFCPNPSYYAKQVLAAREAFEQGRMGEGDQQRLYRQEGVYQQAYPGPQGPAPLQTSAPNPNPPAPNYDYPAPGPAVAPPPAYAAEPPFYPAAQPAAQAPPPENNFFPPPDNFPPPAYPAEPPSTYQPPSFPAEPSYPTEPSYPPAAPAPMQDYSGSPPFNPTPPPTYNAPVDPGANLNT